MKAYKDKNSVPPSGIRSLVDKASALDMPRTWVRVLASVRFFSFVPLSPFLCAALVKRWKVQFRKSLHKLTTLNQKRHILMKTAVLYICIINIVVIVVGVIDTSYNFHHDYYYNGY